MHDDAPRLTELLKTCDYDRSRLSAADAAEVLNLARAARIELFRPGLRWPSSPGAEDRGAEVTRLEARHP